MCSRKMVKDAYMPIGSVYDLLPNELVLRKAVSASGRSINTDRRRLQLKLPQSYMLREVNKTDYQSTYNGYK